MSLPKILILDIETAPLIASVWALFDQNIGLNQIEKDWHLLSWSAKWLGDPDSKLIYMDQRSARDVTNDKKIVKEIHKLLDQCDIVITQNGKRFDIKKLNARFIIHGLNPPSSYKHIDVCQIARNRFGFTSNKLEYLTKKLCKKSVKSSHKKFPGFELWKECLAGNKEAWKEMEEYNKKDVTSLEELYNVIKAWDNSINFSLYSNNSEHICKCGSRHFKRNGYWYSSTGKFQRYKCTTCGSETRDRTNLLSKEKKKNLRVPAK